MQPLTMARTLLLALFLLVTVSEAFVSPAVRGLSAVKGQRQAPVVFLADDNNGGSKKKKKKKKANSVKKKKVVKKKVAKKKKKKKAAKETEAASTESAPKTETPTAALQSETIKSATTPGPQDDPPLEEPKSELKEEPNIIQTVEVPKTVQTLATGKVTQTDTPLHEIGMPPTSAKPRPGIDVGLLGDMTGGRPGAIIESEEQLNRKQEIFDEIDRGDRQYDEKIMSEYGTLVEDEEAEYDTDDPDALDMGELGSWTYKDLQSRFDYEWDPEDGDPDPNFLELQQPGVRFKDGADVDEDGIEIGYDPMYGPSSPQDGRTIMGSIESYMINEKTKDEAMLTPEFPEGDLEIKYNQDFVKFRKSLDIIETYADEFYTDMELPRHVAKWHGYPEPMSFPHKNETNNRFLDETATDWSKLNPYQARRKAIELARAQNADWLPKGKSKAWHDAQREPYERVGTLVGSLRKADTIDETLVEAIQPALDILGSCVDLLSIEQGTVYRFHYHGLMKNRIGMAAWTETLIRDCGVEVTGVVFEAGFRKRDYEYDGGDCWYHPSS